MAAVLIIFILHFPQARRHLAAEYSDKHIPPPSQKPHKPPGGSVVSQGWEIRMEKWPRGGWYKEG